MNPRYKSPIAPIQYRIEWNSDFIRKVRYGFYSQDDFSKFLSPTYDSKTSAIRIIPFPPKGGGCTPHPQIPNLSICNLALPNIKVTYNLIEFYQNYEKCKRTPRLCLCPPHRKDHFCTFNIGSKGGIIGPNRNQNDNTVDSLLKNPKGSGQYQISANVHGFGHTRYVGVVYGPNNCSKNNPKSFGQEGLRPGCREFGLNLTNIYLYKGRPK